MARIRCTRTSVTARTRVTYNSPTRPGRNEPGTGRLNIPALLRAIEGSGYAGWFGAEYRPRHTTAASFEWMREVQARSAA